MSAFDDYTSQMRLVQAQSALGFGLGVYRPISNSVSSSAQNSKDQEVSQEQLLLLIEEGE